MARAFQMLASVTSVVGEVLDDVGEGGGGRQIVVGVEFGLSHQHVYVIHVGVEFLLVVECDVVGVVHLAVVLLRLFLHGTFLDG